MMKTKILGLLLGTVIGFSGFPQAQAQMAPGANVRTTTDSAAHVPGTAPLRIDTTNEPNTNITNNTSPAATGGTTSAVNSIGQMASDPCPEPKKALAGTPDDLAKIQEDITRFTLCVQRAQLLERLNELAEANIDTIDTALNLTASQGVDGNAMPGIMPNTNNSAPPIPSVPSNMFADMDDEDVVMPRNSGSDTIGFSGGTAPSRQAFNDVNWQIRGITGSDGKLTAQLIDTAGSIIRVSQGDSLPDDEWTVRSITNTRVEVEKDDQRQPLRWVQ